MMRASLVPAGAGSTRKHGSRGMTLVVALAGFVSTLAVAAGFFSLSYLRPQRDDWGALLARIREFRTVEHDLLAARQLAEYVLQAYPTRDVYRQQVHFEYGMTYYDARAFAEALPVFTNLEQEYASGTWEAADPQVVLDDAWFYRGDLLIRAGEFEAGREHLLELRAQWPGSNVHARALQYTSRALIQEELADWQPAPGIRRSGTIDHQREIEANLLTLVEEQPPAGVLASAYLDVINYFHSAAAVRGSGHALAGRRIMPLVEQMITLLPEERATARAKLDLADALYATNPERAYALLGEAQAAATQFQDSELWNDARFLAGSLYSRAGQAAEARTAWTALLTLEQTPQFRGEVQLLIASTYTREGDPQTASAVLATVAADLTVPLDVRLHALFHRALAERNSDNWPLAHKLLLEIVAQQPDGMAAAAARVLDPSLPTSR
jgi:hypothetical protein